MDSSESHSGSDGDDTVFTCPECDATVTVNPSMKLALIDNGCVMCGASVQSSAFSPAE